MSAFLRLSFVLSTCLLLVVSPLAVAQDETKDAAGQEANDSKQAEDAKKTDAATDERKADSPKAEEKNTAANDEKKEPEDPVAAFEALNKKRLDSFSKLRDIQKEFADAKSNEAKRALRDRFEDIVRDFNVNVYPEMVRLAPQVFAAKPENLDAGEIVLQDLYSTNQYQKSLETAQAIIKAGRKTKNALYFGGVSAFALHNFDLALELLTEADKRKMLSPGEQSFLDYAKSYKEEKLWEKEQEIRANEAKLQGDQRLPRVELDTEKGKIVIELFEDDAPNTVANFITLTEAKKYDGVKFHRVLANFMCQGGDPNTLDDDPTNDGQGGPGYNIKCECYGDDYRRHFRGSLSMAKGPLRDTGGSQFFITHLPTPWLNVDKERESGHTVFGRVVSGMEVVDAMTPGTVIKTAKVLNKRPHEYKVVKVGDEEKKDDDKKSGEGDDKKSDSDAKAKKD